jgi:hypothetical protein
MLTTVHRETSPWDAHIVAGRLRAEGLHPSLFAEHWIGLHWCRSMAYGMVQIQVPAPEAAAARRVLDDWRAGHHHQALERELGLPATARCPHCAHYDWVPVRQRDARLLACVLFFWGATIPPALAGRRCCACGHVERWGDFTAGPGPEPESQPTHA